MRRPFDASDALFIGALVLFVGALLVHAPVFGLCVAMGLTIKGLHRLDPTPVLLGVDSRGYTLSKRMRYRRRVLEVKAAKRSDTECVCEDEECPRCERDESEERDRVLANTSVR